MHHVRKGDLWEWEERVRIGRVGSEYQEGESPYPSASREVSTEGVKRGGSLRIPALSAPRPSLVRMSSAESLKASHDASRGIDSPAGIKLWAGWARQTGSPGPLAALLGDDYSSEDDRVDELMDLGQPTSDIDFKPNSCAAKTYLDGSPVMSFLQGEETVTEEIREVLRDMVDRDPQNRPTADELLELWDQLGVGRRIKR